MQISIVIPVHNRAEMVKPTLESVKKQTYRPLHLVLVDNNSTDGTLQELLNFKKKNETQDLKIDVIEEKKHGACAARNAGAKLVHSEWLMFFDSDDTMDDCLVAKYVQKINESEGDVDLVCTRVDLNANGKVWSPFFAKRDFLINHIFHSVLSTQRYIIRKSLFERVGGWNESVTCWNDWELGIRILLQTPKVEIVADGVYVHINVHADSITGAGYSCGHERRENALKVAIHSVNESNCPHKERLLKLLYLRGIVLAGLYKKENRLDLAKRLYEEYVCKIRKNRMLRLFAPIVYYYVGFGGRGIYRAIKLIFNNTYL